MTQPLSHAPRFAWLALGLAALTACEDEPPIERTVVRHYASYLECVTSDLRYTTARWRPVETASEDAGPREKPWVFFDHQWGVRAEVEVVEKFDAHFKRFKVDRVPRLVGTHTPGERYEIELVHGCVKNVSAEGGTFTNKTQRTFWCATPEICATLKKIEEGTFKRVRVRGRHPDLRGAPELIEALVDETPRGNKDMAGDLVPRVKDAVERANREIGTAIRHSDPSRDGDVAERAVRSAQNGVESAWSDAAEVVVMLTLVSGNDPHKREFDDMRAGARSGHATLLASLGYAFSVDGIEVLRAKIDSKAPCVSSSKPKHARRGLKDGESRATHAVRFDGPKEQPILAPGPNTMRLMCYDEARKCITRQNVTAELLGLQPDPELTFEKERTRRLATTKGKALASVKWEGERGEQAEYVWPRHVTKKAEVLASREGEERLTIGPYRFALRDSSGQAIYKLRPPHMPRQECMRNEASFVQPPSGDAIVRASILAHSNCHQDIHGYETEVVEIAEVRPDGSTAVRIHDDRYDYSGANCDDWTRRTTNFDVGGRIVEWRRYSGDNSCTHNEIVQCEGIVADCDQPQCSYFPGGRGWGTYSVTVQHGDARVRLGQLGVKSFSEVSYACGPQAEE